MCVALTKILMLLLAAAMQRSNGQSGDIYADQIYQLWDIINATGPMDQLHIAFMSSNLDYMQAVQAINYTFNLASSNNGAAQQNAISVQILPIYLPPEFPYNFTEMVLLELYNFNVDIIVGDNTWLLQELATIFNIPNVLLYYFPQMSEVSQVYVEFLLGFYVKSDLPPQFAPLDSVYNYLQSTGLDAAYSYNQDYGYDYGYGGSLDTPPNPPYVEYPTNIPNFNLTLITYNPYFLMYNPILLNFTVIVDAAIPNQVDMQLFQVITSTAFSKSAMVALYFLTIPVIVTQDELDTFVLNLMPFPGPRFVYATAGTAAGLISSINRLGAFSTSFTKPTYQWTFYNLTGGSASSPDYNSYVCAPYIYHWESYNLGALGSCPMACPTCDGNTYNRMLECDFGFYLNAVVQAYAGLAPSSSNKRDSVISALNNTADASLFISGQHVFARSSSYSWSRVGMSMTLYVGANENNAKPMTSCVLPPSESWTCYSLFNGSAWAPQTSDDHTILITVYATYPYYYWNASIGAYDGFYVALANLLSQQIPFSSYNITGISLPGSYNATTRSWSGVIGEVLDSADIGMAPMTPYANLTQALAFSNPITQTTFSVLQQVPNPAVSFGDLFKLIFQPFNTANWIIQLASIIAVALLLTVFDYFSPNMVMFSVKRSWFYVFARSVMGAGGQSPDVFSSQILMLFWSFVTMITISTYTANLIALSIDSSSNMYAATLSDLLDTPLQPCFIAESFTATYFMASTVPLEAAVWAAASNCIFPTQAAALTALSNWSDPNAPYYSLVTLQPSAMYAANAYQNLLVTVNYSMINMFLAIPNGLQAGVPIASINAALTQLTTAGNLTAIVNQYLRMPSAPFTPTAWDQLSNAFNENSDATLFNFQRMAGVFLIMVFGAVLSLVAAAIERGVTFGWKTMEARKRTAMENLVRNEILSSRPGGSGSQNTGSSNVTKSTTPTTKFENEDT